MKLSCTQENLRSALSTLERVVGKQSTLPILSNILLETDKGQLRLSATNLEIGVITTIGAKIEAEGKITVPAKLLTNFIQNLALDQIVGIEQVGTQVVLQSGNYTVKINGLDGKDFPIIPERTESETFSIEADTLRQGLQKTLFCVSLNESRSELTGVLLGFRGRGVYLTATDSFRLAEWWAETGMEGDIEHLITQSLSSIVPAYTFQEVLRVIAQWSGKIKVTLEENQIFFEIGGTHIVSRLINGKFPEYQAIIPKQFSTKITLQQAELQRALKIAASFSVYGTGEVLLQLDPNTNYLEIRSSSQGVGEQIAKVPCEGTIMETLQLIFNPRYILEGSTSISGAECVLSLNSPTTPVRISSAEEPEKHIYIVMPIRK